ncbi:MULTISPECIES: acyl-CoA dehydrogenase family protein [unclassified Modestobacter]
MTAGEMRLFRPTADQRELTSAAAAVFAAAARAATDAGEGSAWRLLAESGFLGAGVPEEQGGLGLLPSDLALLSEEAGRALVPGPVVETLWLAAPALAALGAAGADALGPLLTGESWCSAVDEDLRGPDLDRAVAVVVPGAAGDHVVPADALAGCTPVPTADRLERSFQAASVDRDAGGSLPHLAGVGAVPLGRLGGAAYLVGITGRLLELTVAHATDRTQFGVPIGSFQAVRHRLADVHVELEFARSAVWSAAGEVEEGTPSAATGVLCAAVTARRAFALADRHCLQVHGGIGFTWEHPLHLLLKRGATLAARFGTRRSLEARLGDQLLATVAGLPPEAPPRPAI